jgi:hypothetical protein
MAGGSVLLQAMCNVLANVRPNTLNVIKLTFLGGVVAAHHAHC